MFLLILMLIFFVIIFIFYFKHRSKKYIKFLKLNSCALQNLSLLNEKYNFHKPSTIFDESHKYDNEKFYNLISCEDYLIYQLQFKKYKVEEEIKQINLNNEKYINYLKDIKTINHFGKYTNASYLNHKKLTKIEQKLFNQNILHPKTKFNITISLYCSKINGYIYREKIKTFSVEEIKDLINKLNNKNGNFYNDRHIWETICRVERGKVSNKMRFAIYKRDKYRCQICGRSDAFDWLEIDHIKPIAKGGKTTYDNLQTLCQSCNKEKGDKY